MTILVAVEGVLRDEYNQPIIEGEALVRVLSASTRVVLCTDGDTSDAKRYLDSRLFTAYSTLVGKEQVIPGEDLRARQLLLERQSGKIDFLIDPSPSRAVSAMKSGVPALVFVRAGVANEEWRSDVPQAVRPWGIIEAEIEKRSKEKMEAVMKDVDIAWEE